MQPLLMLKQTLEATYDPGPLLIDGPNVQFTLAEQFLSKLIREKGTDRFQIQIETRMSDFSFSVTTTFRKGPSGIEIAKMKRSKRKLEAAPLFPPKHITLSPEMRTEEIKSLAKQRLIPIDSDVVGRSRCFLRFESQDGYMRSNRTPNLESHIFNSIHLPGLRGNPERSYKFS